MEKPLVRLICWDEAVARERAASLAGSGYRVESARLSPSGMIGQFKKLAPAAVLVDLDRLPSHGHAVATVLRQSPSTRYIPIVFAGGAPEKLDRIRKELPDAVIVAWKNVCPALKKAIANPPLNPAKPVSHMQRYQGSPLVTKLGLKPNQKLAVIAAPEGFEEAVGEWPEGIDVQPRLGASTELAIWFVRSAREMTAVADHLGIHLRKGVSAWICYPKQSGRHKVDFNGTDLRAACLEVGLVDYKICAVDADWSGMKFTRKKA
jgi:CheY-like chemotaxis protein